ncbi:hypothetical protein GYMLUDRAFT_34268 [Collybiopsis luxurians FD-317 M1]|nr:hypothetical protein GYMLUDRAFT_34268 [Collybiopsis luxurians FD-317 M1]
MGQNQSSSGARQARTSNNELTADPNTGGNVSFASTSSARCRSASQPTSAKFSRTTRRTRAVRNSFMNLVKPKTTSRAANYGQDVNEEDGPVAENSPELSSHRSAWRRSMGFVKSRRWHRTPDQSIIDDEGRETASVSDSDASLPKSVPSPSSPTSSSGSAVLSETSNSQVEPPVLGPADTSTIAAENMPVEALSQNTDTSAAMNEHPTPTSSGEETSDATILIPNNETVISDPIAPSVTPSTDNVSGIRDIVSDSSAPSNISSSSAPTASTAAATAPISPARGQFPSGALVVVQGVVHTADIPVSAGSSQLPPQYPNSNSSPVEPSQSSDEARSSRRSSSSRLSAFLRRSHEANAGSRPASVASARDGESLNSGNQVDVDSGESHNLHEAPEEDNNPPSVYETPEATTPISPLSTSPPASPSQRPSEQDSPSSSISSSSIDVLGTLLSVAAAATAASLLTTSSDRVSSTGQPHSRPVASSNVSPSSSSSSASSVVDSAHQPISQPHLGSPNTLPTTMHPAPPTRSSPNSGLSDSIGDGARAERMRQVWSTVRNRLGLGHPHQRRNDAYTPSSHGTISPNTDSAADVMSDAEDRRRRRSSAGPLTDARDARERMLGEIARAFNLGLSSSPPLASQEGELDSGLPAEGTFERFLVDLQVDLRGVLTGDRSLQELEQPSTQNPVASQEALPGDFSTREPEPEDDDEAEPASSSYGTRDSDDDLDTEPSRLRVSPPSNSAIHEPNSPPVRDEAASGPSNARRRINYWRVYRFPPIPAPRAHAAAESVAQNMRSGLSGLTSPPPVVPLSPSHPSPLESPRAISSESVVGAEPSPLAQSDSPNSTSGNTNLVVPVIVVGLQSVNAIWASESVPVTSPNGNTSFEPSATDGENNEPRGGSRWPSRAASALRNLRRQSAPAPASSSMFSDTAPSTSTSMQTTPVGTTSQGTQTTPNRGAPVSLPDLLSSSRTFLIYVIGGYYPPDHEIVTGDSNILDSSFEALLSLHELLNHPFDTTPTVSKEQLERSGLEVIPGAQIADWEKAGKVRTNCVDRCLICLDDYDAQDSVRVLECKHAFHMDCVDKWLLEGKNSCPACRGKGVSEVTEA